MGQTESGKWSLHIKSINSIRAIFVLFYLSLLPFLITQTIMKWKMSLHFQIHDSSLGGSSDDDDFLGVLRGPSSFANAFLYVGLGTVAIGLVISFVGTGEKGFKTVELRLIGPSLIGKRHLRHKLGRILLKILWQYDILIRIYIFFTSSTGIGLICCILRIFFCICPSHCISSSRRKLKKKNAKVDADHTTSLLRGDSKRVQIARGALVRPLFNNEFGN